MQNIDDLRKQKQMYLVQNIIEAGEDPILFQQYLADSKEEGCNIDNWTFEELKQQVYLFKRLSQLNVEYSNNMTEKNLLNKSIVSNLYDDQIQQDGTPIKQFDTPQQVESVLIPQEQQVQQGSILQSFIVDQAQYNQQTKNRQSEMLRQILKIEDIDISDNVQQLNTPRYIEIDQQQQNQQQKVQHKSTESNDYKVHIQAIKQTLKPNFQFLKKCKIIKSEQKGGGILSLGYSYTVYIVHTDNFGEIERRYSDFIWLRQILVKCYPGFVIPPLLNKKSKKEGRDKKRREFLNIFLNQIIKNKEFNYCPYVQAFFGSANQNEFYEIQKQGENSRQYFDPKYMCFFDGYTTGSISKQKDIFNQGMDQYTQLVQPIYRELKQDFKQLMNNLQTLQQTYYKIGSNFSKLDQITSEINKVLNEQSLTKLNEIYNKMNQQMINIGNQIEGQILSTQENMYTLIKYNNQQFKTYEDVLQQRNQFAQQYKKQYLITKSKKEKIFESKDLANFDLNPEIHKIYSMDQLLSNKQLCFQHMCQSSNKITEEAKQIFSFYELQSYTQINNNFDQKFKMYSDYYSKYANTNIKIYNNIINSFQEVKNQINQI